MLVTTIRYAIRITRTHTLFEQREDSLVAPDDSMSKHAYVLHWQEMAIYDYGNDDGYYSSFQKFLEKLRVRGTNLYALGDDPQ